jgi:hypothetical protein
VRFDNTQLIKLLTSTKDIDIQLTHIAGHSATKFVGTKPPLVRFSDSGVGRNQALFR